MYSEVINMMIVIDLSKKLNGFNLLDSFFYKFKNDGTLVFANNSLTEDGKNIDYDKLRTNILNILYDYHVNSFSICVLYDMELQRIDPINYSITSNIYNIKEKIIKPILGDYIFDKFYYISIDSVSRNYDGLCIDNNVRMGIEFDANGYIKEEYDGEYDYVLFTLDEILSFDRELIDIKSQLNDRDTILKFYKDKISIIFDSKIYLLKEKFSSYEFYINRIDKVHKMFLKEIDKISLSNLIVKPSDILINLLKLEVSSYSDQDVIIIRVNLNDKHMNYNNEVLRYRNQFKIMGILIYLAMMDTREIFVGNKMIGRENHFTIDMELNDNVLYRMLNSYNLKLKTELAKTYKFINNDIEYRKFTPRTFNFTMDMTKPSLPITPSYSLFYDKKDNGKMEIFINKLYDRYLYGVDNVNKRVALLMAKLRIQKEAKLSGQLVKGSILEVNAEISRLEKLIKELEHKIAVYKPKEIIDSSVNIKNEYEDSLKKIHMLMLKRIKDKTLVNNLCLMMIISLFIYLFLQGIYLDNLSEFMIIMIVLFMPSFIYVFFQIKYLIFLKGSILKEIQKIVDNNEMLVNSLFDNDNEISLYVQNIYNLIMLKKYVNEYKNKVIQCNRQFKKFNYHYDKLNEHIELSNKLLEILNINGIEEDMVKIDKIKELKMDDDIIKNPLYCPISYLLLDDDISNEVIVNDEQKININCKLIGFISKFIIKYDKEYSDD